MTPEEIEDLAFAGAPLPERLDTPDTLLFLMFRNLYDYAKQTQMPREQGAKEKQRILRLYEQYRFDDKMRLHHVQVIKGTERALSDYMREPSLENADKMVEAFRGFLGRKNP